MSVSGVNGNFTVNASILTAGKWAFLINITAYGYAKITNLLEINPLTAPTASIVNASYAGGGLFIVSGAGLNSKSTLIIDGSVAEIVSSTSTQLTYRIPNYPSKMSRSKYNDAMSRVARGKIMADTPTKRSRVMDFKG